MQCVTQVFHTLDVIIWQLNWAQVQDEGSVCERVQGQRQAVEFSSTLLEEKIGSL